MARRTPIQLALGAMGLIVWGYGARANDEVLTLVGIGFFAAAFLLRFWKTGRDEPDEPDESG